LLRIVSPVSLAAAAWRVSASVSVSLVSCGLPCHLKRPLRESPVREGNERDQAASRHQRARRNAAIEQQAGGEGAGRQGEHEASNLGCRNPAPGGIWNHAMQERPAAGPAGEGGGV